MVEHYDEHGNLVAVTTDQPNETQPANLAYVRACPFRRFPAELAVKHGDDYFVVALNRNQLMNMLEAGTKMLREFDKRPIEDEEIG